MPTTLSRTPHLLSPSRLERINILGPTIQFLTDPTDDRSPCIMRGTIPPGVSVPLHSHADPETFFVLSGELEGLSHSGDAHTWIAMKAGDVFHVPRDAKHAFRNLGREPAVMFIVSTSKIGRFFQEVGVPVREGLPSLPPSTAEIQRFLDTAAKYGYWNATPEENANVGIVLPCI